MLGSDISKIAGLLYLELNVCVRLDEHGDSLRLGTEFVKCTNFTSLHLTLWPHAPPIEQTTAVAAAGEYVKIIEVAARALLSTYIRKMKRAVCLFVGNDGMNVT